MRSLDKTEYFKSCRPFVFQVASCSFNTSHLLLHFQVAFDFNNCNFCDKLISSKSVIDPTVGDIGAKPTYSP